MNQPDEHEAIQRLRAAVSAALREPGGNNESLAQVCRACVELLPVDGASVSVMTAEQHAGSLEMDQAFETLRTYGRARSARLSDIAALLATGRLDPRAVLAGQRPPA
jgi:hypothetical protein